MDNLIDNRLVEILGYDIVRRDRNRHGGGVAIYIRNNLVYINRNDIMPDILEAICIEVKKPRMKPLLVCSWYRAPDLSVEIFDHFEIFLQNIEHENRDVILTGDMNCNLLSTETNRKIEKFQDLMRNYQLKQHITTPTRITKFILILRLI